MVKFTERDIAIIAGTAGVLDFLTEGRFSAPVARALKKAIRRLGPPAVTTTGRIAGTAAMAALRAAPALASTARFITMRHPYIAAAVVTYEVVKNREQIAQLAQEGWEVVQPVAQQIYDVAEPSGVYDITPGARLPFVKKLTKKRPSKFNAAIKKGMKAIKASTSYGKKGKISNAKKAFTLVTKTVSKLMRRKKVSSKGPTGVVKRALPGISKITIRQAK
jgi:hypothetical protein